MAAAPSTLEPVDRAFEAIYNDHVADVYRYAVVLLGNAADAEDVTQTAFLNAYRAFRRGERPQKPQNWLITITHNLCRQRFRNAARRPQETELDVAAVDAPVAEDEGPTPEELRRALASLSFNQRSALVMRELEDRSYTEIAAILGVSVSAVETLLFRARRALREQLEGTLTCAEAELALSRRSDGRLSREEQGPLRAHLRECKECAGLERRLRGRRAALKSLAAVPLPSSLASFFGGGGGAAVGAGIGAGAVVKAVSLLAAGLLAAGAGYEGLRSANERPHERQAPAPAPAIVELEQPQVPFRADAARSKHPAAAVAAVTRRRAPARPAVEHPQAPPAAPSALTAAPTEAPAASVVHAEPPTPTTTAAAPAPAPPPAAPAPPVLEAPALPAPSLPETPALPATPSLPPAPSAPALTVPTPPVAVPATPAVTTASPVQAPALPAANG